MKRVTLTFDPKGDIKNSWLMCPCVFPNPSNNQAKVRHGRSQICSIASQICRSLQVFISKYDSRKERRLVPPADSYYIKSNGCVDATRAKQFCLHTFLQSAWRTRSTHAQMYSGASCSTVATCSGHNNRRYVDESTRTPSDAEIYVTQTLMHAYNFVGRYSIFVLQSTILLKRPKCTNAHRSFC